jgi:hypothetical protein
VIRPRREANVGKRHFTVLAWPRIDSISAVLQNSGRQYLRGRTKRGDYRTSFAVVVITNRPISLP